MKKLSDHVSSIAFSLSLTKEMIDVILSVADHKPLPYEQLTWAMPSQTGRDLLSMGLINGDEFLTKEGKKVAELLILVGHTKLA